jgi:hypothetical protein
MWRSVDPSIQDVLCCCLLASRPVVQNWCSRLHCWEICPCSRPCVRGPAFFFFYVCISLNSRLVIVHFCAVILSVILCHHMCSCRLWCVCTSYSAWSVLSRGWSRAVLAMMLSVRYTEFFSVLSRGWEGKRSPYWMWEPYTLAEVCFLFVCLFLKTKTVFRK